MLTSWDHLHGIPGEKPDSEVKEAAGSWRCEFSWIGWTWAILRTQNFGPALGWVVYLHGNQESRQGYKPQLSKERGLQWGCRTSQAICGERRRIANCFKKIHIGKKVVKTVRLSYVLLDSGKLIFLLFYVFSKFSIISMYFLNQENKTLKKIEGDLFLQMRVHLFFYLTFISHLIKKIKMLLKLGSVWSPKSMLDFCAFHLYVFTLCRDWNVENIYLNSTGMLKNS